MPLSDIWRKMEVSLNRRSLVRLPCLFFWTALVAAVVRGAPPSVPSKANFGTDNFSQTSPTLVNRGFHAYELGSDAGQRVGVQESSPSLLPKGHPAKPLQKEAAVFEEGEHTRALQLAQSQDFVLGKAEVSSHRRPPEMVSEPGQTPATQGQQQHVTWDPKEASSLPQQVNLSQVLIQNSPQLFLNWDQPAGGQQGRTTAGNGYDWRKHVHNQPGRKPRGAADVKELAVQRERQQALLIEVFALGRDIDNRQARLAEYQKARQQLQKLLVLQLELLEQLGNLDAQQHEDGAHVKQKESSAKLAADEHKCSLNNFPLADSFLQVKRYALSAPAPSRPLMPRPDFTNRLGDAVLQRAPALPTRQTIRQQLLQLSDQELNWLTSQRTAKAAELASPGHQVHSTATLEQALRVLPLPPHRDSRKEPPEELQSDNADQESHQSRKPGDMRAGGLLDPLPHGLARRSVPGELKDEKQQSEASRQQPYAARADAAGKTPQQPQNSTIAEPRTQPRDVLESPHRVESARSRDETLLDQQYSNARAGFTESEENSEEKAAVSRFHQGAQETRREPLGELWAALHGEMIPSSLQAGEQPQSRPEPRSAVERPKTEPPESLSATVATKPGDRSLRVLRGWQEEQVVSLTRRLQKKHEEVLSQSSVLKKQQQTIRALYQHYLGLQLNGKRKQSSTSDIRREDQAVGPGGTQRPKVMAMQSKGFR